MAEQENGYRANIGSPSLILIFIVMCLITFGMLSLSTAKSERNLAERNASAVTEYYRADREGEAFYQMVLNKAAKVREESQDPQERKQLLARELGDVYEPDKGTVTVNIPMERSQALSIELVFPPEGEEDIRISKWKVIQTEDMEIDHSMPVWTGGET
ncbi:short-chain dehydrogenase [Lacrimispora sp.]|uniref:short-chain dehydrogenase n=1 Tax=Lacrimispora sp. TaxID=2719234 RepID=UPI00289BF30A|nr:short-chain dehydrogenase [Lacrimispora sp.]